VALNEMDQGLLLKILEWAIYIVWAPIMWCIHQINKLKTDYWETRVHAEKPYLPRAESKEDVNKINEKLDHIIESQGKLYQELGNKANRD